MGQRPLYRALYQLERIQRRRQGDTLLRAVKSELTVEGVSHRRARPLAAGRR